MDNNMNNSNDMNNSINNMNNNAMPDKSTAEGEGLYTEAVQMHSESEAARQGFVQPKEAAAEVAAPAEATWNDTSASVAGNAGNMGAGTDGIGQTPQQMNEVPHTGTGRQIYQVGDQWQIGSPQTGQQYTQGDTQRGVYGTGADQWQTVKEQQPYGASQYDQNNGNGAWQQNSTAQYQNQSSGQWQQNAGQYQTQHNEHPNCSHALFNPVNILSCRF